MSPCRLGLATVPPVRCSRHVHDPTCPQAYPLMCEAFSGPGRPVGGLSTRRTVGMSTCPRDRLGAVIAPFRRCTRLRSGMSISRRVHKHTRRHMKSGGAGFRGGRWAPVQRVAFRRKLQQGQKKTAALDEPVIRHSPLAEGFFRYSACAAEALLWHMGYSIEKFSGGVIWSHAEVLF